MLRNEFSRTRANLETEHSRFQSLLDNSLDAIAYIHEGMHVETNPAYRKLFDLSKDEIDGFSIIDLISHDARRDLKQALKQVSNKEEIRKTICCRRSNGQEFEANMEFGSSEIDGEQCVRVIIRHQGADSMQARIRELKNQDPHTGLLNRHTFMHRLDQLLDRGQNQPDALLMMLSIDNFTQINDEAGMIKSDCLLKETADLLALHVDDRELLGRFGDHQFIAVIRAHSSPEVTRQGYLETFQRARLEQCCELPTAPRFSIGLTPVPDGDRESAHELVRRCIHASREENATQHSAGLIEQGAPDDSGVPIDRNIVDLIDHALENDHFVLEYQPMVSLDGDTRENYSVFVRLLDQTDTPRDPEWFFGQAMHTERMAEIDRWVVRRTISELSRRRSSGER